MAAAAVGRIHPGKRWHVAVEIVEAVRRRGHNLSLTLVGHRDIAEYERQLEALAASRPWFRMERDLSREQLAATLATHRYGIHPMQDEHFGIAPAELQRAGRPARNLAPSLYRPLRRVAGIRPSQKLCPESLPPALPLRDGREPGHRFPDRRR